MAAIIKCKMCGGDLALVENSTIATCEYCGTQQTVPTQDNEKKLIQFERAERLRKNCEFDKAAGVYESIVADFRQEAEAYWGLVLCKYGIEYVDDPGSGKKVPTCHRSSFESIMEDPNFEQVLENADALSRKVYRDEAKAIEQIRKGIIEVSSKEDPYDIFICYKETAEDGQRTVDSVLAQDIYDALTDKGYRVFFSRITLEDRLGQEYEPYIFAALNSAKVMLAIGTDYEYFNAVWVKNEWSRYLKLMEKDKSKHLIPCFKGIDAYDMPKEFSKLQAQDLGKVGAVQDLLRGIDKLIAAKPAVQQTAGVQSDDVNRIYIYNSAMEDMKSKKVKKSKDAVKKLESLGAWGDAATQLENAKKHLKKRKAARTVRRIITLVIILAIIGTIGIAILGQYKGYYDDGVKYMAQGNYARAAGKFKQASFYKDAQQQQEAALANAKLADEKLRSLIPATGEPSFYYGDDWVNEVLEDHKITEGEVVIYEGNSYNGLMSSLRAEFTITGNGGEITYLLEEDAFLFTPDSGEAQQIRIENGVMTLEDGTTYGSAGSVMEKISQQVDAMIESGDLDQASEAMYVLLELVGSGMISADSSVFHSLESVINTSATMLEKGQSEGFDMLLTTTHFALEIFGSGNCTDAQVAYNIYEAIVNTAERLIQNDHMEAIELLAISMEFFPMAEAGVLGDDMTVIEQFKTLYDRAEQIMNEN